jgi:hypothetical protein
MKLSEAARKARNEYNRKWRLKNPDKVKQYFQDYWERKAAELNSGESLEDKINRLHNEGFSLREIAAKVGINHVKVSRILKS